MDFLNVELLLKLVLAVLWGGLVGAEREFHSKSAGFRTMIMISLGSCLFTILSIQMGAGSETDRIAANILTGIGFLGAGVIFRFEQKINGITTAATIWAVAAVGMSIGSGQYAAAAYASIIMLIVLSGMTFLEKWIDSLKKTRIYTIKANINDIDTFNRLIKKHELRYKTNKYVKEKDTVIVNWSVYGKKENHTAFIEAMIDEPKAIYFEY